jgi:chromosome condensin MukBEF complex kleisin-like MukF subunit
MAGTVLCETTIVRGGGNRKHLQIQINRSSFQITVNYREGCKNIKRKACRIRSFGRSSINIWLGYDKMYTIRGTSKQDN